MLTVEYLLPLSEIVVLTISQSTWLDEYHNGNDDRESKNKKTIPDHLNNSDIQ